MYKEILLVLLLIYLWYGISEPFTVHVESDFNPLSWIKNTVSSTSENIKNYTIKPMYTKGVRLIPYRHHFHKLRRYFR